MAYATGTGANITDLMDALRGFAVGQGWTVDKWDSVDRLLFLSKGSCAVSMRGDTTVTRQEYTGPNNAGVLSAALPDHHLRLALNTSNTPGLTTFHSHPGSVVTSNGDGEQIVVNGLTGPFVAWHFFADATVGDHIHCVVQINAECYMHFSFGHVDKKGLTHSGVAYVTGQPNIYWRNVSQYNVSPGNAQSYNRTNRQNIPFLRTSNYGAFGSHDEAMPLILRNTDAWPAAWTAPGVSVVGRDGANPHFRVNLRYSNAFTHPNQYPANANAWGFLLDLVVISEPTPYSNIVPMFPVPCIRSYYNSADQSLNRYCYVGDFPNVRVLNMTNLTPGQEITLGADTWKVFPALKQRPWESDGIEDSPTTGQYAVAYKKVP